MERNGQKSIFLAALLGLCEIAAFSVARAEPPMQKVAGTLLPSTKGPERSAPRLDLRAPTAMQTGEEALGAFAHRMSMNSESFGSHPAAQESGHIMSPMQTLAHNFRQEGLPVARLFENSTSLVHVGLNPKGKPGLWVVHKLH